MASRPALSAEAWGNARAMDQDMRGGADNRRMAGPAVTLRVHTADILMVGKALSECPKGSVLAIDGQGELNTALWGAITTACARIKGVEVIVIDGALRDVPLTQHHNFPPFTHPL